MIRVNRIVLWGLSTLSSLVLLLGYHTSTSGPATSASASAVAGTGTSGGSAGASGGSAGPGDQVVTGSVVSTQWGPVQVEVTLAGGTISSVQVLQRPSGNPQDDVINDSALPVLIDETLKAQSADIDMVSGATVTSVGYLQSLQSALDQVSS